MENKINNQEPQSRLWQTLRRQKIKNLWAKNSMKYLILIIFCLGFKVSLVVSQDKTILYDETFIKEALVRNLRLFHSHLIFEQLNKNKENIDFYNYSVYGITKNITETYIPFPRLNYNYNTTLQLEVIKDSSFFEDDVVLLSWYWQYYDYKSCNSSFAIMYKRDKYKDTFMNLLSAGYIFYRPSYKEKGNTISYSEKILFLSGEYIKDWNFKDIIKYSNFNSNQYFAKELVLLRYSNYKPINIKVKLKDDFNLDASFFSDVLGKEINISLIYKDYHLTETSTPLAQE